MRRVFREDGIPELITAKYIHRRELYIVLNQILISFHHLSSEIDIDQEQPDEHTDNKYLECRIHPVFRFETNYA